jgi:glycine oxidase
MFAGLSETLPFGFDLDFSGILRVASDGPGAERLRARAAWQRAAGLEARFLDPREVQELAPGAAAVTAGLWVPDGQVSPLRLTLALAAGATRLGADVREGVTVRGFAPGRVDTAAGPLLCDTVIVAAGAWSGSLTGLPVGPLKGQRLLVREASRSLGCIFWGDGAYLVPKPGGGILVGATEEPEAGFDPRVTLGATQQLSAAAIRLVPALGGAELVETWAGFRPTTPDHLPVLGPLSGHRSVWVASGHHRNGILLSALSGELIAGALVDGAAIPASCAPERFAGQPD